MRKLHELHYKDGAGTVDIKNVNKTLPSYRVPTLSSLSTAFSATQKQWSRTPDKRGGGGGIEDNSKTIFKFFDNNVHCDTSLELSQQDGSNEGSQYSWLVDLGFTAL